jgi:hypothetical protein
MIALEDRFLLYRCGLQTTERHLCPEPHRRRRYFLFATIGQVTSLVQQFIFNPVGRISDGMFDFALRNVENALLCREPYVSPSLVLGLLPPQ